MKPFRLLARLAPVALLCVSAPAALSACGGSPPTPATAGAAPPPASAASAPVAADANEPAPALRLPTDVRPTAETLALHLDPRKDRFSGAVDIAITLDRPRSVVFLHGRGLDVSRATATPEGGAEIVGTWKQEDPSGMASLRLPSTLPAGKARLHLEYTGPLPTQLDGVYKTTRDADAYIFTQFESIGARAAFPCFDEPGFKIPFETTLFVPSGMQAIANTHEVDRAGEGDGVRVHFAPTLPLPSYLVAFAVGPLDVVAAPDAPPNAVRKRPLPIRAVTTRGHGKDIAYALAHTGEFVALLEKHFGIEYPYDKLDILAVGDKGGAMENAGAVTFADELLLFDDKTAPVRQKRGYAEVMAHELAHQWTGDLVTAAWWDDIWLNEAFATWIESKVADQWDPSTDSRMGLLQGVQGAIGSDALTSARSIRQPIATNDDIENAFDSITYQKGGGVLSMFERWVGEDAFRKGLHDYLAAHAFGNATADDFLAAESAASGKDVKTPFHTFLDQPGVPFVEAEVRCDGSPRLHLKQQRYFPLGSTGDVNRTWQIPVCARFGVGKDAKEACTLLTDREGDLPLGEACPDWVLPNADAAGYYRFSLSAPDLDKLRHKGFGSLTARERVAYANGLRAAWNRGVLPMKDVMQASEALATDDRASIAGEPMGFVGQAHAWLHGDWSQAAVERYARTLFGPIFRKLGWEPARGEAPERAELRASVLRFLLFTGKDPALRAEAQKRGLAYLGYGKDAAAKPDAVSPDLVGTVLGVVGEEADAALWDWTRARLAKTDDPETRQRLLGVLVSAKKPELVARVRELSFDPVLRPTEVTAPVWAKLGDEDTRDATWDWVKANFDRLLKVVPEHHGQTQLVSLGGEFCDEEHARDAEAFYTPARIAGIDGAPRTLAGALEANRLCIAKRRKQEAGVRDFFKGR